MNEVSDGFGAVSSSMDGLLGQMGIIFGVLFLLVVVVSILRRDAGILKAFVVITLFGVVVGSVTLMFGEAQQEREDWRKFAAEHCKVIEKRDGQSTTGIGLSLTGKVGTFFGSTSSQTGYHCDDGVTYWKNY
ncbi:hypothetical protein RHL03_004552 [Escherichia coli]|uniref:hypothetical protein n=1 Tax=Escherichia coli TaxID=562 RepID=UPI0019A3B5BD|nr:hypothetical protein [Escherichia coli]EAQ9552917.1 hypothetical protein [Salmonella enterica]EFX1552018.1 hypothetical protein [Shigella sonnei]EKD5861534.1 hypothetical protein [Escherichia coli]ELB3515696.1 hypothetical protein [Escherichia coli]MBP0722467.1 hypothetical protein [Escherichia coli]